VEIKELITFKTIVETGSFTNTAKKLHYAQSTITGHIKQLEASLGQALFKKNGRKSVLTSYGRDIYINALELINKYEQIKNINHESKTISGNLYIGAPESTMLYKLYHIIQEYRRKYPEVNIIIKSGTCRELRDQVLLGELDLTFVLEPGGIYDYNENLTVEKFTKERINIVTSIENKANSLMDLANCSIINTETGCSYREMFHKILKDNSINCINSMETPSLELIKKYVMCDIGVSFLPYYSIEKEVKENKLKILEVEKEYSMYTSMISNNNRWKNPAMVEFMNLTKEYFKKIEKK